MRNTFILTLVEEARKNKKIVLMVGDLGYNVVEPFISEFPDRFFNAGVAEQNMMGMAAGMASEGYHVWVYSIANFPTFRCAEQIRNDVDYHNLPVTIVSVGGGLAYGNLGYSHHAIQDFALLRTLPNMLIAAPGDPREVHACMTYLFNNPQPSYLRLGKAGEPTIHTDIPQLNPGQWVNVGKALSRNTFLTTGATLDLVNKWRLLYPEWREYAHHSLPLWGMATKSAQAEFLVNFDKVISVEEHLDDAGFGSWLNESVQNIPNWDGRIHRIALKSNVCGAVGTQSVLNTLGGLSILGMDP